MTDCLRFPLRFTGGRAETVVQNSDDDLKQRALLVLSYPLGACVDLPPFGTPDVAFSQSGADVDILAGTLNRWEPQIPAVVARTLLDESTDNLLVSIGNAGSPDA
jgi:hypothetical protein